MCLEYNNLHCILVCKTKKIALYFYSLKKLGNRASK